MSSSIRYWVIKFYQITVKNEFGDCLEKAVSLWPIIYKFLKMADRDLERLQRENEDPGELIYELDEKGQPVVVKSLESTSSVYLRFTNRTPRAVDVWWRDFRGAKRHYVRLEAGTYFDINSYLTHPWEFTDVATKESCVINNKTIFRPPSNIGGMMYRTNWNITIRVRCLRYTCLLVLAQHLRDPAVVNSLGLPRVLTEELKKLIVVFHRPRTPPRRDWRQILFTIAMMVIFVYLIGCYIHYLVNRVFVRFFKWLMILLLDCGFGLLQSVAWHWLDQTRLIHVSNFQPILCVVRNSISYLREKEELCVGVCYFAAVQ